MGNTSIQWTHKTENPLRRAGSLANYCQKISPACEHCYAEVMSRRLAAISGTAFIPYKVVSPPPELELRREIIAAWAKRKKPYRNFVCSMTDLFLHLVPEEWIFEILDGMVAAPLQTFQILTKRAQRMYEVTTKYLLRRGMEAFPPNIWLLVTTENQKYYEERVPWLLQCRASVLGISAEPLLGPINLTECTLDTVFIHPLTGQVDLPELMKKKIGKLNWVIAGGESGNKNTVRPSHPAWFQSLRDQCKEYDVPFFFKQWGTYYTGYCDISTRVPDFRMFDNFDRWVNKASTWVQGGKLVSIDGRQCSIGKDMMECKYPVAIMHKIGAKKAGNILDGVPYLEFPKQ